MGLRSGYSSRPAFWGPFGVMKADDESVACCRPRGVAGLSEEEQAKDQDPDPRDALRTQG